MYKDHKDIPAKYRRLILDEFLVKRVAKVPLSACNEFIQECIREETEMENLKNYEVIIIKNGAKREYKFKDSESAFVALDREIGYDVHDSALVAVLKQADRIVRAYVKGKWIDGRKSIYTI